MKRTAIVLLILFFAVASQADMIYFKDGTVVEAEGSWESYDKIMTSQDGKTIGYPVDTVERIVKTNKLGIGNDVKPRPRIVLVVHDLYNGLMRFKDEPQFHNIGFSMGYGDNKYIRWQKYVRLAANDPDRKFIEKQGIKVTDLLVLAEEYRKTQGKEDDLTQKMKEQFNALFK